MFDVHRKVRAGHGAVAAGRDVIIVRHGLTEAELAALVREATLPHVDALCETSAELGRYQEALATATAKRDALQADLDIRRDALEKMFQILGRDNVPPERLAEALAGLAEENHRLRAEIEALSSAEPKVQDLLIAARSAADRGDHPHAEELLAAVEVSLQNTAVRHQLEVAQTRALRAHNALATRDWLTAAAHFARAAASVPPDDNAVRVAYMFGQAEALEAHGVERVDNQVLEESIDIYYSALASSRGI